MYFSPIKERILAEGRHNYFVDVYKFIKDVKDEDIHIQTEEALGYKFVTREELKQIAATGEFLHYDSIKQVFED